MRSGGTGCQGGGSSGGGGVLVHTHCAAESENSIEKVKAGAHSGKGLFHAAEGRS